MMRFFTNGSWRPRGTIAESPTPVGEACGACGAAIQVDDCGVLLVHVDDGGDAHRPWHLACLRRVLGIEGELA